ncbi:MAG: heavy-metal-associated domain-containing protein [Lautropia sp.]
MISFQVDDMTCGHCVGAITKALKDVDPDATLRIDLATHRVDIVAGKTGDAGASRWRNAIEEAGYTARLVASPDGDEAIAAPARKGCCCR